MSCSPTSWTRAGYSAEEALLLYPYRWSIERMFFDLKEVLNLNHFYAANPNAVAMQVYAAAIVYNALRLAQSEAATMEGSTPRRFRRPESTRRLAPRHVRSICTANSGKTRFASAIRGPTFVCADRGRGPGHTRGCRSYVVRHAKAPGERGGSVAHVVAGNRSLTSAAANDSSIYLSGNAF